MAAGKGTSHHRVHRMTGLVTIVTLPIVLFQLSKAIPAGAGGFQNWLAAPANAILAGIFLGAALWYCKLELDEVILDYTDGGLRSFGLMANKVVAFLVWAVAIYSIVKIVLG